MLFQADLSRALRGRVFLSCIINKLGSAHLVRRRLGVWQLGVTYHPEQGKGPDDFAPQRCLDLLRTATGQPDLEAELMSTFSWEVAALIADKYRHDRVFLAGDAAHVWPPYGGLNGNTGIQDVHNLAWKLAEVLDGTAGPALLDTYEGEPGTHAPHLTDGGVPRGIARRSARPQPGLDQLPDLVDATRRAGVQLDTDVAGGRGGCQSRSNAARMALASSAS